jgi:hypothetical protein
MSLTTLQRAENQLKEHTDIPATDIVQVVVLQNGQVDVRYHFSERANLILLAIQGTIRALDIMHTAYRENLLRAVAEAEAEQSTLQ